MTPEQLDALAELLRDADESIAGPLEATVVTGGRSNLTYRLSDGTSAWALRRPPTGAIVESAHDVVREYRVVSGLYGTNVPVARPVVCDPEGRVLGSPVSVVAWVDGATARSRTDVAGWTPADFAACAEGLVRTLATLHTVDPDVTGLGGLGRRDGYAARQLRRWSGQWERMHATDERADRLHALLRERVPEQSRCAVVHGDYRVDNVLLEPGDPAVVRAVVDWELATLGDPAADVAIMCAYRHPALDDILGLPAAWTSPAFPAPAELRDAYECIAGEGLPAFSFHLALAFYKLAVIVEGIAYRHRAGVVVGEGYDHVARSVPVLLEAGLEEASRRD